MDENNKRIMMRKKLRNWGKSMETIAALQEEISQYRNIAQEEYGVVRGVDLQRVSSGNNISDSTSKRALNMTNLMAAYDLEIQRAQNKILEILAQKKRMESFIERLSPSQKEVITLRYCRKYCWKQISFKSYFHVDYARKLERAAVDQLISLENLNKGLE